MKRFGPLVLACAWLYGCGSAPPGGSSAPSGEDRAVAPATPASPAQAFEQKQRDRALGLTRQGRLADAATAWEVLTVLRPDVSDYRDRLADTRSQIDAAVAERLPKASQAARRGELDGAAQQYLAVLALQPDNAAAADGLRAVERERNKRNYLGKYSRYTLTRRAASEAEMAAPASRLEDRNELEHASMLAGQGDFDEAITLLERRVKASPRDDASRLMLADIYFQKVQAQPSMDRAVAIRSLERSVRLDPTHAGAKARLRQLKGDPAMPAKAASSTAR